ncbi:MAG: hypothetical protein Hyperionvirus2_23 [Hyperionvirus sp.]|uniref:Uncharacterized protein n=1 Tax=Hyperionvirus sp. TaxID=2487770 RepID=A0A3G5A5X8_9VIRU|nr:MAG: hypothetical protein Hyperionvirus2_23 [Hyperionvirus sp.]
MLLALSMFRPWFKLFRRKESARVKEFPGLFAVSKNIPSFAKF